MSFANGNMNKLSQQERARIPASYVKLVRETIEEEIRRTKNDQTELDKLNYLRKRQKEMQEKGVFVRPDGGIGFAPTDPDEKYGHGKLETLIQSNQKQDVAARERRVTILKVVGLIIVVIGGGVWFTLAKQTREKNETAESAQATQVVTTALPGETAVPTPIPDLPAIAGGDSALQTIGSLGGMLEIGRPGAIELHYQASGGTIALAIDPSQITNKGELRYASAVMESENPVAVWVFGTVLNYAIGIPDTLVRNLQVGDRLILNTDTGRRLQFVVSSLFDGNNYDTSRWLAQNRVGLTLFSLPALAENQVAFALATYDLSLEDQELRKPLTMSDTIPLNNTDLHITGLHMAHIAGGQVQVVLSGTVTAPTQETILISLASHHEQTEAQTVLITAENTWQLQFLGSANLPGTSLFAELRTFPSGTVQTVYLGELPDLVAQVVVTVTGAVWDNGRQEMLVTLAVYNPGQSAVWLPASYVTLQGGDAPTPNTYFTLTPVLPRLLNPGQTETWFLSVAPQPTEPTILQIGTGLWEIPSSPVIP